MVQTDSLTGQLNDLLPAFTDTPFDIYEILLYVKPVDKGQIPTIKRL